MTDVLAYGKATENILVLVVTLYEIIIYACKYLKAAVIFISKIVICNKC